MGEFFENSVFFGVLISFASYGLGTVLKRKFKLALFHPLLIAIILTMAVLVLFRVDYESYHAGAQYLSYLLGPATVCLAIPLYEQFQLLRQNLKAVLGGIFSGVLTSLCSVLFLAAGDGSQRLCDAAAQIHHHGDWDGGYTGIGRPCFLNGGGYYHYWDFRQYAGPAGV